MEPNNKIVWLTNIQEHCAEYDQSEPPIECDREEYDGDQNIDDRWHDREQNVIEQIGDAVCAAVHDAQHFARFTLQMPAQRQTVQMPKQFHFDLARGELLNADPQIRA